MSLAAIKAIIYDMDGLLLDTEIFYTQVTQQIVARYNKTFDWSIKSQMIGRPALDSARFLVSALSLPISAEQYLTERGTLLAQLFPAAKAKPGAEALVRYLHQRGIPQAVATSSSDQLYRLKTQNHAWFDLFDCIVTVDDPEVINGKPAPDIFLAAARRLNTEPRHCLVFEDAPSGTQAGLAAGMTVIAVPEPEMDPAAFSGAAEVLASLEQFYPRQWGLGANDASGKNQVKS